MAPELWSGCQALIFSVSVFLPQAAVGVLSSAFVFFRVSLACSQVVIGSSDDTRCRIDWPEAGDPHRPLESAGVHGMSLDDEMAAA